MTIVPVLTLENSSLHYRPLSLWIFKDFPFPEIENAELLFRSLSLSKGKVARSFVSVPELVEGY